MPVPFHTLRKSYSTIQSLLMKRLNPLCLVERLLYHPSLLYHSILWRAQLGLFPCNMLSAFIHSSLMECINFCLSLGKPHLSSFTAGPFHTVEGIDFLASFHNTILPSFGMALPTSYFLATYYCTLLHFWIKLLIFQNCLYHPALLYHSAPLETWYSTLRPSFTPLGRGLFSSCFSEIFSRFYHPSFLSHSKLEKHVIRPWIPFWKGLISQHFSIVSFILSCSVISRC